MNVRKAAISFLVDDSGAGFVEYALIVSLVSIASVMSLLSLGKRPSGMLLNAAAALK